MRKLSLVIAGILGAGSPLISQAATLGDARVQSNLTEPLEVSVPLKRSANEPLDEIKAQLAPPAFYEQAGVPLESLPANLVFNVETRDGQDYVVIRSRGAIHDPILSILLEVRSPEGRMVREYNLLLDPPSGDGASEPDAAAAPSAERAPTPRAATSSWERVEPTTDMELDDSYTVQRGDTLSRIAARFADEGEDIRPIMQAIIDANPDAFVDGNGNALMADAELQVPSAQPTADEESGESQAQSPALELLGPEERAEGAEAEDGDTTADAEASSPENVLPAIDGPTRAELERQAALDKEELESARAENETLTEDLRSLSEQIDSVKLSIDERDSKISELEAAVEQARQEKAALEQQNARLEQLEGNFWIEWGKYLVGGLGLVVLALLIALGLRRRRNEEPALPASQQGGTQPPTTPESEASRPETAAVAAGAGAAAATAVASEADSDESGEVDTASLSGASGQDPLDPQTALDEARMLESFNLNQQAIELLQDSLTEHPGHDGLQEALARLQNGDSLHADEAGEPSAAEPEAPSGLDEAAGLGTVAPQVAETEREGETAFTGEPEAFSEGHSGESAEEQREAESSPGGMIDWDDDLDNMLATTDSEPEPRQTDEPEDLMDFDDSYALETPGSDEAKKTDQAVGGNEVDFDLPEIDETATSDLEAEEDDHAAPTWSEREDADDLSLQGAPEEESEQPVSIHTEEPEETGDEGSAGEDALDTRVSLAEAFLDVGDRESFEMIESELKEEGATEALQRLDELKKRYG